MNRSEIFEIVKRYILEQLPIKAERVVEEARVIEDLGADSANLMMLVMDLESEFDTMVEDDALSGIHTVGDIVDYIAKKKA
ncbi:MAG: acyl carrier protein [Clostridia bacterium]|nr:acyl carrier protein [Clostridia bacterium]